jgi:hypothetical protein
MPRKTATPVDLNRVTPVIFRKFRNGEIIALFPFHAGNNDGYTCQSFVHVGQHGSADPHLVMRMTKPATEHEANDLIAELTSDPYNYPPLRILHRFTDAARREREAQVQR